jgi:4a-hydroxytetrahydrobiopterin dehydratase
MDQLHPKDFHAVPGTDDWRVLFWGANAFYRTGSFAQAVEFVGRIGDAADAVGHAPDVDVRPEGVAIRTTTGRDGSLSAKDAELAVAVSEAAHAMGLTPDPSVLQFVGIAVAQDAGVDSRPFWEAAFGYVRVGDEDLIDPVRRGPHLWFHELTPPRAGRGRTHIDVSVPADQVEARVQGALAAGGRVVSGSADEASYTIASPDNHKVDIAGWADYSA